jgi:hypothetical protein
MKLPSLRSLLAAVAAVCLLTAAAQAADPTGTWTWSQPGRDGTPRKSTLTLALKDGALTGSISGRGGEIAIGDASFKDPAIAFTVTRQMGDNTMTIKYSGTLDGDTIKGSIVMPPPPDGGDPRTVDWTATRGAAAAPAPAN